MNNKMRLPESEHLDIQHFSRLFDNMSESYKLFWFQAIVEQVLNGKDKMSYDELLNHMVVSAWYMVSEYHLNLGQATRWKVWWIMYIKPVV